MSKTIDELREHFNQRPVPNSKVIIEERSKVNAMIDAVEAENAKLRELVRMMLMVAGVAEYATDIEWQTITHYLRELGIEVD